MAPSDLREAVVEDFTVFFEACEPRLLLALSAAYGFEVGREATADALTYAWEQWDKVKTMGNPAGYLFRVGQSRSRRYLRWKRNPTRAAVSFEQPPPEELPTVEPGLVQALRGLSRKQRLAVVLVHGYGWSETETAELVGVSRTTIQKHGERGLAKLRAAIGVGIDV